MPAKFDGPLDNGKLDDINLESATWKPVRSSRWSFDVVRPQFLSSHLGSSKSHLRPTAWLDGLRGFAALLVYLHHNQLWAHDGFGNIVFENSFGYEGRHYFAALPFVRNFFSGGHFAVSIFFIISGYVLSVKPLSLIQNGQRHDAADNIASALFRRWVRLYIPVIGVTLTWVAFRHWTKMWMELPDLQNTFREELLNWYYMFKNFSFVFLTGEQWAFANVYHAHVWSIPIEFKGSIIIYTALLAFSRCTRNARLWCETSLIVYFLYIVDGWYGALFVSGMLLADLDLLAASNQLPRFLSMLENFKELIFFHLFIIGLYLGGVPSCDAPDLKQGLIGKSPGWIWLWKLKPQAVWEPKWFYLFWAALLVVSAVPRLPWLKRFFEMRFCQYLARISFALYLVHGPMIFLLADRLNAAAGLTREKHQEGIPGWVDKFPLPKKGPMGLELAFWGPQLIIFPVTLYLAEMVTKVFDEPSVKFAGWFYRTTLAPPSTIHKRARSSIS
ncbi:hypothetical protein P154DRAFT_612204 [Amniculicola lignicola CBS 123094]|uniref:Acyltransferase 3 domain-containing protein n=1 Tax=Amniculicola lignicola CBS 123094 TaxID=1392246 RepID=A0A6A5W2B5_9PLEO|nr:hypothetical protein P154DRAFT_612204 [Amniculicola lignicola CBS 123094]